MEHLDLDAYLTSTETPADPRLLSLDLQRWPEETLSDEARLLRHLCQTARSPWAQYLDRNPDVGEVDWDERGTEPLVQPVHPLPAPELSEDDEILLAQLQEVPDRVPVALLELLGEDRHRRRLSRLRQRIPEHQVWSGGRGLTHSEYQDWYRWGDLEVVQETLQARRPPVYPVFGTISWTRYATIVTALGGDPITEGPRRWQTGRLEEMPEDVLEALQRQCRWTLVLPLWQACRELDPQTLGQLIRWGRIEIRHQPHPIYLPADQARQLQEAGLPELLPNWETSVVIGLDGLREAADAARFPHHVLRELAREMAGPSLGPWWLERPAQPGLWPEDLHLQSASAHLFLYGEYRVQDGYYIWWSPRGAEQAAAWQPPARLAPPSKSAMILITECWTRQVEVPDWQVELIWLPIRAHWPRGPAPKSARSALP